MNAQEKHANDELITALRAENKELRERESLVALYRKIEANARSLRDGALESMSASPPEGYDDLEGKAVEVADECCRDGIMAMQTAVLNFLYDQMTEAEKAHLAQSNAPGAGKEDV